MTITARPRPGTRFLPLAEWLDERGYVLSDRIWAVSEATMARIDALLADGIARGRSAVDIAKDLEQFLRPERRRVLTRTPYGTLGSYDARRLARSEITRANSVSFLAASARNPFVTRIHHRLSARHDPSRCNGSCDALAAEDRRRGGWPVDEAPILVDQTHPHCLCTQYAETDPHALESLRAGMQRGDTPAITPLAEVVLTNLILGWSIYHYLTPTPSG